MSERRTVELPWKLTVPQSKMFRSPARFVCCVAGRRFGKTIYALTWLAHEVGKSPEGSLGYYVAPYRVMAKAIAWDKLLQLTKAWRVSYNVSELTVTLPGDRKIALKGADDPETLEGVGLVAVVLDEFDRMKRQAWENSLRPALSDHSGRALFIGKPRGHSHLKEFYERGQSRDAQWKDWDSYLWTTAEGGNVPLGDIAEAQSTLPEKVYRQEYEASFEMLAGRVYDQFTRRTHVVKHAEIERLYKREGRWIFRRIVVGVDHGYTDPGVALVVGQTGDGRLVVIHEEYHRGLLVSEDGWLGIYKRLRDEFHPEQFVADPSSPGNIAAMRKSLNGAPVVRNANNNRHEGIRRVNVAMLTKPDGIPGLLISDRCTNTIRELEQYVYEEHAGKPTEEPKDGDDHCCDSLKYSVFSLT